MRVGGIIQARLSSTRLPNKVLLSLPYNSKISVLEHIIKRTQKVQMINEIIVATSDTESDDSIESFSRELGVKFFRGDEQDVLSRFFLAAQENNLEIIVRLTGDNPCIDYNVINSTIDFHINRGSDYTVTKGYPLGLDVEVLSFNALEKAFYRAKQDFEREHVTLYIYKTRPDLFKITLVEAPEELNSPDIRITLDTEEDYALLCAVFDYLYPLDEFFSIKDIVELFKKKPWLKLINKKNIQKKIHDSLEEEIRETIKICDLQDLKKVKIFLEAQLYEGFNNN